MRHGVKIWALVQERKLPDDMWFLDTFLAALGDRCSGCFGPGGTSRLVLTFVDTVYLKLCVISFQISIPSFLSIAELVLLSD